MTTLVPLAFFEQALTHALRTPPPAAADATVTSEDPAFPEVFEEFTDASPEPLPAPGPVRMVSSTPFHVVEPVQVIDTAVEEQVVETGEAQTVEAVPAKGIVPEPAVGPPLMNETRPAQLPVPSSLLPAPDAPPQRTASLLPLSKPAAPAKTAPVLDFVGPSAGPAPITPPAILVTPGVEPAVVAAPTEFVAPATEPTPVAVPVRLPVAHETALRLRLASSPASLPTTIGKKEEPEADTIFKAPVLPVAIAPAAPIVAEPLASAPEAKVPPVELLPVSMPPSIPRTNHLAFSARLVPIAREGISAPQVMPTPSPQLPPERMQVSVERLLASTAGPQGTLEQPQAFPERPQAPAAQPQPFSARPQASLQLPKASPEPRNLIQAAPLPPRIPTEPLKEAAVPQPIALAAESDPETKPELPAPEAAPKFAVPIAAEVPAPPPASETLPAKPVERTSSPEPAHEPATARPPEIARDIRLEIGHSDHRVELRVMERGGEVRVAVRTPNAGLAGDLHENLPDLSRRLESAGYRTETLRETSVAAIGEVRTLETLRPVEGPASTNHRPSDNQSNSNPQSRQDQRERRGDAQPDSQNPRKQKGNDFEWLMSSLR